MSEEKYFKFGDKIRYQEGTIINSDNDEINWAEEKKTELRVSEDHASGQITIGVLDFNFSYKEDLLSSEEDSISFNIDRFAVKIFRDGRRFKCEDADESDEKENLEKELDKVQKTAIISQGNDNYLSELIKVLKKLDVKTIIFNDGNSIDIN